MRISVRAAAVVTGLLLVTFLVILGTRLFREDPALGVNDASLAAAKRNTAITDVAKSVTTAFLDVDYRDMDPRIEKVLDQATGTFEKQYDAARANLTKAAVQGKATSVGTVRYVGLGKVTDRTATALVAADSTVSNAVIAAAKAKGQPVDEKRYYRFQLELTRVKGTWLVDDLQFVG